MCRSQARRKSARLNCSTGRPGAERISSRQVLGQRRFPVHGVKVQVFAIPGLGVSISKTFNLIVLGPVVFHAHMCQIDCLPALIGRQLQHRVQRLVVSGEPGRLTQDIPEQGRATSKAGGDEDRSCAVAASRVGWWRQVRVLGRGRVPDRASSLRAAVGDVGRMAVAGAAAVRVPVPARPQRSGDVLSRLGSSQSGGSWACGGPVIDFVWKRHGLWPDCGCAPNGSFRVLSGRSLRER